MARILVVRNLEKRVSGGAEWGGRSPTQYVAPFGSIGGATSDAQDLGATAWSNAASVSTPVTLGTALARAVAANIVGLNAGSYTLTQNPANNQAYNIPVSNPTNSGTSGNPIIFQAQWPAIGSYASNLRSKISNGVTSGDLGVATIGVTGRNYVIWDGVWVDEDVSRSRADAGPAVLWNTTGSHMRRCRIDMALIDRSGDNHPGLRIEEAVDCIAHSNYIRNGTFGTSVNQCGIQVFESNGIDITNNLVDDCNTGVYIKDDNSPIAGGFGDIIIRYNKITNCGQAIRIHDPSHNNTSINYVEQNLIVTAADAGIFINTGGLANTPKLWQILNNTCVDCSGSGAIEINFQRTDGGTHLEDTVIRDNLIDGGLQFLRVWDTLSDITTWRGRGFAGSYNCVRGTTRYARVASTNYDNTNISGFHTDTQLGSGGQSLGSDPFVDRAGGNYRLSNGHAATTASSTGGPIGCYVTGNETIGLEAA